MHLLLLFIFNLFIVIIHYTTSPIWKIPGYATVRLQSLTSFNNYIDPFSFEYLKMTLEYKVPHNITGTHSNRVPVIDGTLGYNIITYKLVDSWRPTRYRSRFSLITRVMCFLNLNIYKQDLISIHHGVKLISKHNLLFTNWKFR